MLKKVLSKLQGSLKNLDHLDSSDPNLLKKTSKLASSYNFFIEVSVGNKKKTKQMIEWLEQGLIQEKQKDFLFYFNLFRSFWQKTMINYSKDSFFNEKDWQSKHKFDQETVRDFFYAMIDFCNVNETKIESKQFGFVDVNHFKEYLERYLVWEKEIEASALSLKGGKP